MDPTDRPITLREIPQTNREAIKALGVSPSQRRFVAGVRDSLREAEETPQANPWYRAIYAADEPVS